MSPASDPAYPSDVRAALLDAARGELADRGAGALSLRAIAARAGVSRATPTWHFGDRAGLLTALAIEGYMALQAALRAALAGVEGPEDPAARFTAIGRAYLDFGLENPALYALMFRSEDLHPDSAELAEASRRSFEVLVDVAGRAADPAAAATSEASDLPLLAWAAAHGLVLLVRDGALQRLTGLPAPGTVDGPDPGIALAHRLAAAFTAATSR